MDGEAVDSAVNGTDKAGGGAHAYLSRTTVDVAALVEAARIGKARCLRRWGTGAVSASSILRKCLDIYKRGAAWIWDAGRSRWGASVGIRSGWGRNRTLLALNIEPCLVMKGWQMDKHSRMPTLR